LAAASIGSRNRFIAAALLSSGLMRFLDLRTMRGYQNSFPMARSLFESKGVSNVQFP
jgi:hypothetical protein